MNEKPSPKTGAARIWSAYRYTLKGLGHASAHEAAFRQALVLVGILSFVLIFLPLPMI